MSKRNWLIISKAPLLAALLGAGVIAAPGCNKKQADGETGSTNGAASGGKAAGDPATPGVTATEIKIGQTMPYSGPASAYSSIGKGDQAFFKMINDKGGINGHKITLISLDDGYNPAKAVEQTHKLVENEGVAFTFNGLGTANTTAVQKYLNDKKIPQLFVATGADKWADPQHFPWTIGLQPSYQVEAKIYAKYLMKEKPAAKVCVLYQNDDFGKDYLAGLKAGFGDQYDKFIIKTASYEATDPTIDSQLVTLQGAGCDTLISAATPKFGAQSIRKAFDLGWKPMHIISNVSIARASVLQPAGLDKAKGLMTAAYFKDPADPRWKDDAELNEYRAWAKQYAPDIDANTDGNLLYGWAASNVMAEVLKACGGDFSRANVMKQATSLSKIPFKGGLPGVVINTSATDFRPIEQMQMATFNGDFFEPFGDLISAD
jgi:branched-chain amino acid transport system substrate-binding protein